MQRSRHHVIALLRAGEFRRLLRTRLASQLADGLFQASLAGSVLFNPDRQADPLLVAIGFAVLLLPYSVIGPFAGVLLDRLRRRNVLVAANVIRSMLVPLVAALIWSGGGTMPFLLLALLAIGVNRFFLTGLSASLPHVSPDEHLLTANSLSTTSGTIVFSIGIGSAVGLLQVVGDNNRGYALVALTSIVFYLASAWSARGFPPDRLGPDDAERAALPSLRIALADVGRGMVAGIQHLRERRTAGYALLTISAHRIFYGVSTIATLLLYRNYFTGSTLFPGGEVGLGQIVAAGAAGALLAAMVTPWATRRFTPRAWVTGLLIGTAVVQLGLGAWYTTATLVPAAFAVGAAAQGIKIVADTSVQTECDDAFQGRVFAVYDTLFNVCLVLGLLLGAVTLPDSGKSYTVIVALSLGYLALAGAFAWVSGKWAQCHVPVLETV